MQQGGLVEAVLLGHGSSSHARAVTASHREKKCGGDRRNDCSDTKEGAR
jgi:hypothetical protein